MSQIKLINGSSRVIKIGDPLKLHATKKNSCDIANIGDVIIGTSTQQVSPGSWCVINTLNTVAWNDIIGKPTSFNTDPNATVSSGNSYFPSGW
jgi:hypothetical protein